MGMNRSYGLKVEDEMENIKGEGTVLLEYIHDTCYRT
jgi:hypothetical protein